ncbi:septum formation inhibitor Maf [Nitratiruptor sp. SB155-2]|uniref:Nucleoside triphosphate pyrophosphatase n=1 Tax=Nitratiruptor sp. (strain SB155-2) TaxID=387092 RepID=NTPP_NITSB|nr:septum formation inhibitor Maf [Nitratiruptor sp. SB155-2]A6Q573.1 RecName: Full=Nucleoside triphosphate pyrophosphatase; AltName: Full=Nucleotide pyrophosphatase; Short=Nucleotide PPase [Nitratiruptor sp. SB155-2]BAF70632.1 septum formation protein [Nitratiruptor sp. SB155-2]
MIRLASTSETRAKLLQDTGIEFIQSPVDFDEEELLKVYKNPRDFVCAAARGKMEAAVEKYGLEIPIVAADTVVAVSDEILRKAKDEEEARKILQKQSGNKVDIITCMIYKDKEKTVEDLDVTSYIFAPFDEEDLQNYLKSGQWRGKAGACMVEGFCKKYIKEVLGRESTAMGLQVERLAEIAKDL